MIVRLALLVALALLGIASLRTTPLEIGLAQQVTPTPTPTRTATPTSSATPTVTRTATATATPQPTGTSTPMPSATPTVRAVVSPTLITRTPTRTATPPATQTATVTRTATAAATAQPTQTTTPTVTPTAARADLIAIAVTSLTRSSATITWNSSLPATSQVEFGTVAIDAGHTTIDPSLVTSHRQVLSGLQPGTTYRFRVRSATASAALAISAESILTTMPADFGPALGDVAAGPVTSTTATISWLTGTGTVGQLEYGSTADYTASTLLKVFRLPTQSLTLTGLRPRTEYHFRVKEWDGIGALGASDDFTFTTAPAGTTTLVGEPIVYPQAASVPGGQAAAYQYIARESGQANSLRLFLDSGTASVVRVGLYSDDNGAPGTILTQGSTPGASIGWTSVNIPPVALVRGQPYWVVVLSPLGNASIRELGLAGVKVTSQQSALAALPSTWLSNTTSLRGPMAVDVQQVAPAVTLLGPADGAIVSGKTTLSAVVDDDQPVARVQFLVDGVPLGTPLTAPPYSLEWDTTALATNQPHVITARANDLIGRTGTSAGVTVQVDNGPRVRNVVVGRGPTTSSARISWSTDVPSDAQVEYGPTADYGLLTPLNPRAEMNHTADLTGLVPGSVYHFRIRSRDANGVLGISVDGLFVT